MAAVAATAPDSKAAIKPVETAALPPPKVEPEPMPAVVSAPVIAPVVVGPVVAAAPTPSEPTDSADEGEDEADSTPAPSASAPETLGRAAAAPDAMLDDRGGGVALASGSQLASLPGVYDPEREIVLQAIVDCWIEIRDTLANQRVASRLLRKGDKYTVPMRDGLTLVAGNAGGLEVRVGGDAAPSLGPLGVVRRNVSLDPQKLRDGTAVIE
jgi:cytoskeleton protein RodZ